MNAIAEVVLETTHPLAFDAYEKNKATGRFLLVDPISNQSSGAGMIIGAVKSDKKAVYHTSGAIVAITGANASVIADKLTAKLPVITIKTSALKSIDDQVAEVVSALVREHVIPESFADSFVI